MSNTENKIKQAILRITKGKPTMISSDRKLSISAVADEAGIHRTTIINRYPKLADDIRQRSGYLLKDKDKTVEKIRKLESLLKEARLEVITTKEQLAKSISLQARNILE